MRINLDRSYTARPESSVIGYVGETNAREIIFNGLSVDGADSYSMVIDYGDGENYEIDITDGTYTVGGAVLKREGTVTCQIRAKKANDDGTSYTLVKKSNMFTLIIGKSIEGEPTPIPTYEQALGILDQIKAQANVATVPVGTAYAASYGAAVTPVVGTGSEVTE